MQITIPWKRRVLAKLEDNKKRKIEPFNLEQLRKLVGAEKAGLNKTFDLKRDPQQLTSKYASEICQVLKIAEPLIEADDDDEDFVRDVETLRQLTHESRRDVMLIAARMPKKR